MAEAGDRLVELLELKGRKPSTIEAVRSALRVHLIPQFGDRPLDRIDVRAVERFIAAERREGSAPKSIRNYLGVLHSIFELAIEKGWARENPVKRAAKPEDDGNPEIRFLTIEEVEAVLLAVPDDVLGSIEATLYLTAAMTGLRQGELLGLRWRTWTGSPARSGSAAPTFAESTGRPSRGGDSGRCRSQTASVPSWRRCPAARRSPPTTTWSSATPQTGTPLDRSKVRKRFKAAVKAAGVRDVRFHDLRHTFGTRMAAVGVPMRTLQEWMGHADFKTTLIYADYSPDERRERDLVARAFEARGPIWGPI